MVFRPTFHKKLPPRAGFAARGGNGSTAPRSGSGRFGNDAGDIFLLEQVVESRDIFVE